MKTLRPPRRNMSLFPVYWFRVCRVIFAPPPSLLPPPPSRQTYVQHLISRQHAEVWELLRDPRCHVYVCGDSTMGEEVKAEVRPRVRVPAPRFCVLCRPTTWLVVRV